MTAAGTLVGGCSTPLRQGPSIEPQMGPHFRPSRSIFKGQPLYRSPDTQVQRWATANRATGWLNPILAQPQARWVNSEHDTASLRQASIDASRQGRLLVLVAYNIPDRGCTKGTEGAPTADLYRRYITGLIAALADRPAVVIQEPDAVAADCFTPARAALLNESTGRLTRAGHHVYVDAGHAGWRTSSDMAQRLVAAGITEAEGFAINVAARDSLEAANHYGRELSSLVGNRPYVIDTSRNGVGPTLDARGHQVWCNPPRQGLGVPPSTAPAGLNVAKLWIKNPGESDGNWDGCGAETAYPGLFSPRQARALIDLAPWVGASVRATLPAEESLPWTR